MVLGETQFDVFTKGRFIMNKSITHVILGVFLLVVTVVFVITNQGLFFGDISFNGGTILTLNVTDQANVDQIKDIISISAQVDADSIEVKNSNQEIELRFGITDAKVMASIERALDAEFGDAVRISSYNILGKAEKTPAYYLIYGGTVLMFFISCFLIIHGLIKGVKERKNATLDLKQGV